jgi:trehalose 6-phosphate phosphatase
MMFVSLPAIDANFAFFFDFDGTLVAIAPRPEDVCVEPGVGDLLRDLSGRFDDAVAVVTGRPLDVVDGFLAPLKLATAAEHGSVRRDASGHVYTDTRSLQAVVAAGDALARFVESEPGLLLERKQTSVALHYRQRPELAEVCRAAAKDAVAGADHLVILPGKMVFEVRPKGRDKGAAVEAFLAEAPFKGRVPVYVGDDVTDEDAFAVVNALGGVTIKIDDGDTQAQYRTDREGLFDWLSGLGRKTERLW